MVWRQAIALAHLLLAAAIAGAAPRTPLSAELLGSAPQPHHGSSSLNHQLQVHQHQHQAAIRSGAPPQLLWERGGPGAHAAHSDHPGGGSSKARAQQAVLSGKQQSRKLLSHRQLQARRLAGSLPAPSCCAPWVQLLATWDDLPSLGSSLDLLTFEARVCSAVLQHLAAGAAACGAIRTRLGRPRSCGGTDSEEGDGGTSTSSVECSASPAGEDSAGVQVLITAFLPASTYFVSAAVWQQLASEQPDVLFAADVQLAPANRVLALPAPSPGDVLQAVILSSRNELLGNLTVYAEEQVPAAQEGAPAMLLHLPVAAWDSSLPLYAVGTIVVGLAVMFASVLAAHRWLLRRLRQQQEARATSTLPAVVVGRPAAEAASSASSSTPSSPDESGLTHTMVTPHS